MGIYSALSRASITIELFDDNERYEAIVSSTNGTILQPYDLSTTLIGSVMKENIDVTNKIKDLRWTKWNPSADNLEECADWAKDKRGQSSIIITKDDVDSKSIFTFEAYDNYGKLLCSSSISIVDINDLLVSTKKPEDPYVGQVWVDDSVDPANLYVWNGYKWLVSGAVGVIVKNLFHNSGFAYNHDSWDIVGEKSFMFTPVPHSYLEHRFLRLNSTTLVSARRGISQTTTDEIVPNSDYSVQMLCYSKENSQTYSKKMYLDIYSINETGVESLVYHNEYNLDDRLQSVFACFNSLDSTKCFRVEITGENDHRFDFSIAEPSLYNTHNKYPWTTHPSDTADALTQESVWAALSNNGEIEGIFTGINPNTGQLDYYINASMISAGKMSAKYLDAYNLTVKRLKEDGTESNVNTLLIDELGNISLTAKSLNIAYDSEVVSVQDYVDTQVTDTDTAFTNKINDVNDAIDSIEQSVNDVEDRVTKTESDTQSLFDITDKGLYLSHRSDGTQSFVNINNEEITVKSESIRLEGYTTINDSFKIDVHGNMEAKDGKFSGSITASSIKCGLDPNNPAFSLTADGTLIATDAVIKGTVGSLSAEISDITMSSNGTFMIDADGYMHVQEGSIFNSDVLMCDLDRCVFSNGSININNKFIVNDQGELTVSKINMTGDGDNKPNKVNNANISNSNLNGCEFKNGDINDSDISGGTITNVEITSSPISNLELTTVDIISSNIQQSSLVDTDIEDSDIVNGTMTGTDVNDIDIDNSRITNTDITQSDLDDVNIINSEIKDTSIINTAGTLSINTDGAISAVSITTSGDITSSNLSVEGDVSTSNLSVKNDITSSNLSVTGNITHSDSIIYQGESNTFIAEHYTTPDNKTIGETVTEANSTVLTFGSSNIVYGTMPILDLTADTLTDCQVTFDKPFAAPPFISLTLQYEDPVIYSSVSDVTAEGFIIKCKSATATSAVFNWLAIGAC